MNEYDDWDTDAADSLSDVGFFVAGLVACASLAVLVWVVL